MPWLLEGASLGDVAEEVWRNNEGADLAKLNRGHERATLPGRFLRKDVLIRVHYWPRCSC